MSKVQLEIRRRTAVKLVTEGGMSYRAAAEAVGAVPSSVSIWVNAHREGGEAALAAKPEPKRSHPRLDDVQRARLREVLVEGPRAHGFATELWTLSRINRVIEREFAESFHIGHLWRIVRDLGFSSQKPERRAREQNVEAVEEFRQETWPSLGKGRATRGAPSS